MSTEPQFTLYGYWRSSCSWRVRIVMALKGLKYESIPVPLLKKEQNSEEYMTLNPMQEVPTLVIKEEGKEDIVLNQSMAIIDYLDHMYPEPSVYPKDPLQRARALALALDIASGIQPLQNLAVIVKIAALGGDDAKLKWAQDVIKRGLDNLEKKANKASKYLISDEVTIADVCLVPQIYSANRFGVDMTQYPTLSQIHDRLSELEYFKVSVPEKQSDAF